MRKSYRTFTVTIHLKDNKSKATSSLLLVRMITKLKRPYSNDTKTKTNTEPHKQWEIHKQLINNNRTTALERTVTEATRRGGGGLKCTLLEPNAFYEVKSDNLYMFLICRQPGRTVDARCRIPQPVRILSQPLMYFMLVCI